MWSFSISDTACLSNDRPVREPQPLTFFMREDALLLFHRASRAISWTHLHLKDMLCGHAWQRAHA